MKILVSGASGLLGSSVLKIAHELSLDAKPLRRCSIDTSSIVNTIQNLSLSKANVLIHCAANTNVEHCEQYPEDSFNDNVLLTEILSNACSVTGTKVVFISSTGVYGERLSTPYTEMDTPEPTTVHHACKLQAEQIVMGIAPGPLIIRTGWLFGGEIDNKKNFVANRLREAQKSDGVIFSDISQHGNPTFVDDIARHVLSLSVDGRMGVYNCVNSGNASRFEYVQEIIKASNLKVEVKPVTSSSFKRLAKVSSNESAINFKLSQLGINHMPDWKSSLHSYVQQIGSKF